MCREKKLSGMLTILIVLLLAQFGWSSKLKYVRVLDNQYLILHFMDSEVLYEEEEHYGAYAKNPENVNRIESYGSPLDISAATNPSSWKLVSSEDQNFGSNGKNVSAVHRRKATSGQAQFEWTEPWDYHYEYGMEHYVYLKLPSKLQQGATYSLEIAGSVNSDVGTHTFTYDFYNTVSEAIHVNLVGYASTPSIKAADVFHWMGDGGARDYSSFEGNKVFVYNIDTKEKTEVGKVAFFKNDDQDMWGRSVTASKVWTADFSGYNTPGTYRLAIEGIGASEPFEISSDIYWEPFRVSVLGWFYMRIGQDQNGAFAPIPRKPLYIQDVDPPDCKIHITSVDRFSVGADGDPWDKPDAWAAYKTGRTNPRAIGGHSDALDWDRHSGHVGNIYDLLLPFIASEGALMDDDLGIAESGNGIPDLIDEARNEIDFWLNLRDGQGYSSGVTNPNKQNELFQAKNDPIMAWNAAASSAMLAECFRITGHTDLMNTYVDSALAAYNFIKGQVLDKAVHGMAPSMTGMDFRALMAASLYNITGEKKWEDLLSQSTMVNGPNSTVYTAYGRCQIHSIAMYLKTNRQVNYQQLYDNMKSTIINQAKELEAGYKEKRAARRTTLNSDEAYWLLASNLQHTIVAHSVAEGADKAYFEDALILEGDWGLGRNSANKIMMTTASTALADKRSITDIYSSGQADGVEGLHPGHTPFANLDNWFCGMIMGCPERLWEHSYPSVYEWPRSDAIFNTRYAWAHSEFTPRATMRGKTALYSYLYAIGAKKQTSVSDFNIIKGAVAPGAVKPLTLSIGSVSMQLPQRGAYQIRILNLSGRTVWKDSQILSESSNIVLANQLPQGSYILQLRGKGFNQARTFINH